MRACGLNLDPNRVRELVRQQTERGSFRPATVNVLRLNLALDALASVRR